MKDKVIKYLLDVSFIDNNKLYHSIPLYAFRLLRAIPDEKVKECSLMVRADMVQYFKANYPNYALVVIKNNSFLCKIPRLRVLYTICNYQMTLYKSKYDVLLTFDEYRKETLYNKIGTKRVSIIHDLKGLKNKELDYGWCYNFYKKLIDCSDKIISISSYTKEDILRFYKVPEEKIEVVYNSVEITAPSIKPDSFPVNSNFILYVNSLRNEKNPITLVKAFEKISDKDINVVFVGRETEGWRDVILPYAEEHGIKGKIIRLENVTDSNLRWLYEHARLFVSTSLHEGFGYTPIEAAICKCPVISSLCEALPDTTRMKLNYYEPATDENALAAKINELLLSTPSNEALNYLSSYFSAEYAPHKQALRFVEIMNEISKK